MVEGSSSGWLPPGFTEKVKYRNGRKIKYYYNNTTGSKHYSKKDVLRCATAGNDLSSNEKDDAVLDEINDSPGWLPNGWIVEEKTRPQRGSRQGTPYKVYIELSSGSKFYSRAAIARYLKTLDNVDKPLQDTPQRTSKKLDNVGKPCPDSPQCLSEKLDNVHKPIPDSPQCTPKTNTGRISKRKTKGSPFKMVAVETTADEDLPSGWMKEIRTSKSGDRIRKDPFYIDPASGYVFRSKKDALRYLDTNDIGSCASRPLKRELDDLKSVLNEIPCTDPADETQPNHKRQLFPSAESNDGGEASGTKSLAESVGIDSRKEDTSNKNSTENAETENNTEPAKEDPRIMDFDAAICSPVTDPSSTKKHLPENGTGKQADRARLGSRKSKKRENPSLPLRSSKRLARYEPEVSPNWDFSERSLRASMRKSSGSEVETAPTLKESADTPPPPNIEPIKEATEPATIRKETIEESEPLAKVENPHVTEPATTRKETPEETEPLGKEKPHSEELDIPDNPASGKTSEKQLDGSKGSQESPFHYNFGESWSDPLEFAFKTLRGEISIEDTLKFTACFNKLADVPDNQVNGCLKSSQSEAPVNNRNEFHPPSEPFTLPGTIEQLNLPHKPVDECLKSSQSDAHINFQNVFLPQAESFKKNNTGDHQLPGSNPPLFPAPGNTNLPSCGGFNSQSTTEAAKKDCPTNFRR